MFRQHARGEFTVDVTGPYHCGPNHESPKTFSFEVTMIYKDDALDQNGFLLDNTSFQQYFDSIGSTELSCELLTRKCCYELHRSANGRCHKTSVALWAISNRARVEFTIKGDPQYAPGA